MAAIAPYLINATSGVTVDTQLGLNADPTAMLVESWTTSIENNDVEHSNFAGVPTVMISNTPKYSIAAKAKILARTSGLTNNRPGTAVARATITQYSSGVDHGYPTDSGFFVFSGGMTHDQPKGDLDDYSFNLRFFGFATTSTGTLASSGLS